MLAYCAYCELLFPHSLSLNDFKKKFKNIFTEGTIILDHDNSLHCELHIYFPFDQKDDFDQFLNDYASLHRYRMDTFIKKYPK